MFGKRKQPEADRGQYVRGLEAYCHGQHDQAISRLEPVRRQGGLLGQLAGYYQSMARRALGIEAMRAGRFDRAEDYFRQAAATIGRNADLTGYLAVVYARQRRYGQCADEAAHLVELKGDDPAAWRRLAQAQWSAGRRDQARMTLGDALRELGSRPELHVQEGLFWAAEENFEEAQKSLQRAVEADCTCAEAYYYLALAAQAQGKVTDAVSSFRRAFELKPWDLVLAYQLAVTAAAAGEQGHRIVVSVPEKSAADESAAQRLADYVTAEPEFLEACLSLPESPIDADLFGMLAGVVQMALAAHGDYADLRHYCSRIFTRLGRLDKAMEQVEIAVAINPRYVRALLSAAELCLKTNNPTGALDRVKRAIDCGADWPDVQYMAGKISLQIGAPCEARKHFAKALDLNGGYKQAAEAISALAA